MLTFDYGRLGIRPRDRVLYVGCGEGRHTFEAVRRRGRVTSLDIDRGGLAHTTATVRVGGLGDAACAHGSVQGDATRLPFADATFDVVLCAETLEHIPLDEDAIRELARVLRPGGRLAVSVPRFLPERVCWALSRPYHDTPGGHVRIYRADALDRRITAAGFRRIGRHHAHALHSPYWWVRCAFGAPERSRLARTYQRVLEWDIVHAPTPLRRVERTLDPWLGKSVVLYFERTGTGDA